MTDTQDTPKVQRQILKPFGHDVKQEILTRQKALATLPRQECFEKGYITVKDLDDEELRYGRCRDESGYIPKNGKKTELIPKDRYDEMVAEHELRFKQKLRQQLDDMLDIMVDIAKDDTVEPRDRFEASKYLFERVAGKTPEHISVTVRAAPWEELLGQVSGIAPMSRAEHRALNGAGIVDAEVVEDYGETIETEQYGSQQADEEQGSPPTDTSMRRDDGDQDQASDDVQPMDVQASGEAPTELAVVPVHQTRPGEQHAETATPTFVGEVPTAGEAYDEYVDIQVGPDVRTRTDNNLERDRPAERVDTPDANSRHLNYGRRADEKRSYVDQARAAEDLAKRRKEAKVKIKDATKQRKIARAMGTDAIKDTITGIEVDGNGQLTFDEE